MPSLRPITTFVVAILLLSAFSLHAQNAVGIFENHGDVGTVLHPGSATLDPEKNVYTLQGSGENMWLSADAFQFVWKKVSGDVDLAADIAFATKTGNPHKKAVLVLRQTLDADSIYADVAVHSSGLTALQYRDEKGGLTREVQSLVTAPARVRITRRGDSVYLSLAAPGEMLHYDGESYRVPLQAPFYVGIGVCSHDKDAVEQATFSNVELRTPPPVVAQPVLYSTLETIAVSSTDRTAVYSAAGRFEAPNWSGDGTFFLFNREGHLQKLPVGGGKPEVVSTGSLDQVNNDHGISPDGTQLAISDNTVEKRESLVYVVPLTGGSPRRITANAPSYWHGWSPDGKTLAFVGQRNGDFDIYTIPATGGDETRITTTKGLDDGPEFSPSGQYIYFNSERTGHMQIWRMHPDGSQQEQVFEDDYNNWFPHISPDGKSMVFLTYEKDVTGHPENKNVMLRMMSLADHKIKVLAKLFGGQGTINVPSWSPDSKSVAFVSYELIATESN